MKQRYKTVRICKTKETRICLNCKNKYKIKYNTKLFCSNICADKHIRKLNRAKINFVNQLLGEKVKTLEELELKLKNVKR